MKIRRMKRKAKIKNAKRTRQGALFFWSRLNNVNRPWSQGKHIWMPKSLLDQFKSC